MSREEGKSKNRLYKLDTRLLAKLDANIIDTRLHVLEHVLGELLDCGEAALLEAEYVAEEGEQLLPKIVTDIPQILVRSKESPCHQR